MYGPPGTGKTLLARACAAQTKATFLKLAGPQLVQMFIGDGAKLVRDAFTLAKEKSPTIIFIDELDAIGTKRFDSEKAGDREVQRTMLELLNQLDGFEPNTDIKGLNKKKFSAFWGKIEVRQIFGENWTGEIFVEKTDELQKKLRTADPVFSPVLSYVHYKS